MAWTVVEFKKLYYTVNGGSEKEWNGRYDIPRAPGTQTQLNSIGGTNNSWLYSASRGTHLTEFTLLVGLNGGSGENFWDAVHNMPNNGIILIYRESGNDNIAFAIKKTLAGMVFGTKTGSTYTWVAGTNWGVFAVDSSGNTHLDLISTSSINYAIITDGTKYSFCEIDLGGSEYNNWDYDTNSFVLRCGALGDGVSNVLAFLLYGNIPITSGDPYADTGESSNDQLQTGDATGDADDTSDVISIPSAPTLNLAACQMINVYVPSLTDVQNLAQYLWSNFDLHDVNNTLSKVFTDPINAILSLHILPFTPSSSTAITVTFGGYATSVQIPPASEQFHDVDCGSLSFSEFWGNYLDYNPYTRITACLPFVGQVDIDPDEVMGKTVKIKYRVDIVTGAFVCFLYIDGEKVLGQYAGNMAQQVPVSAADYSRLNAAILGVAATAATGFGIAAAGGFSSPERKEDGGLTITGGGANMSALGHFAGSVIGSGVDNILNAKVRVAHSGGLSGSPGIMGLLKPYVIIHRARQSVPPDANKFKGYPCNATFRLSDLEGCGFTSVRSIKLDGLKLSDGELGELRGILAGGVYL